MREVRGVNEQRRTHLRQGQLAVDPPVLLGDGAVMEPFQTRPGALNHGMLTPEGRPMAVPFQTPAEFGAFLAAEDARYRSLATGLKLE